MRMTQNHLLVTSSCVYQTKVGCLCTSELSKLIAAPHLVGVEIELYSGKNKIVGKVSINFHSFLID